jgi:hypothetical protein
MHGANPKNARHLVNRREMLLATSLAASVPLVPPAQGAASAEEGVRPADPREPRYRETAHVRTFYERSRF